MDREEDPFAPKMSVMFSTRAALRTCKSRRTKKDTALRTPNQGDTEFLLFISFQGERERERERDDDRSFTFWVTRRFCESYGVIIPISFGFSPFENKINSEVKRHGNTIWIQQQQPWKARERALHFSIDKQTSRIRRITIPTASVACWSLIKLCRYTTEHDMAWAM